MILVRASLLGLKDMRNVDSSLQINTLSLAMKFYRQPLGYTAFLDVLNIIFTVFFTMEFVFKLGAFRFKVTATKQIVRRKV